MMKNKNYLLGIIFILAAILMLLNNFHFFYPISTVKVVITILLLYFIVKNIPYRNYFGILIPAAFIFILYDDFLPFQILTPFSVLAAAVLGSIGLSFLFPNQPPFKSDISFGFGSDGGTGTYNSDSEVTCSIAFAGCTKYFESEDLRRAYLKCSFGSLKAYFDHASIIGDSAEIYVDNSFGETNLFLPKEWDVHINASTTFGDISEIHKMKAAPCGAPFVSINGNISFGDCKIFYV